MGARLILLRHARSAWNEEKRCQGSQHEPPLTRLGRRQAVKAARQMQRAGVAPAAIYSSDQVRAVETAMIVRAALGELPLYLDARLREMDQGAWEGMLYSQIEAAYGELYRQFMTAPFEATPPGGESMGQMVRRTYAALDMIAARHPQRTVLVVSHEFPVAAAGCAAAGYPLTQLLEAAPGNCHWFTVRWPLAPAINLPGVQTPSQLPEQTGGGMNRPATGYV